MQDKECLVENQIKNQKICTVCKQMLDLDKFDNQHSRNVAQQRPKEAVLKRNQCRSCRNKRTWVKIKNDPERKAKVYEKKNKGASERYHLLNPEDKKKKNKKNNLNKYGLTFESAKEILKNVQDNKCKICNTEISLIIDNDRSTANVDHDHKYDKKAVRGFLCHSCNTGLGNFKDSIPNLVSAIEYLKNNLLTESLTSSSSSSSLASNLDNLLQD